MRNSGPGPLGPREREPSSGPSAAWMIHAALGAMVVTALGLHLRLDVGLTQAFFAGFLLFTLPFLSVAQLAVLDDEELDRPGVYAGSAVTLVVLTTLALILGALGPGLEAMGLAPGEPTALALATGRLAGVTVVLLLIFLLVAKLAGIDESPILADLLPRNAHERRLFAGLALLAGFGEEVVFRGFLLAVLTPAFGDPWTALAVSSLAFGVLHVYQGPFGILRTSTLGAVLGASVIVDGSLWPAVMVHIVLDLVGGLIYGPRAIPPSRRRSGSSLDTRV